MKHFADVLVRVWVTEKSMSGADERNTIPFEVQPEANKIEIRRAVEQKYGVKVVAVHTVTMPAKARRDRRWRYGHTSARKKALVTLKAGDRIEII